MTERERAPEKQATKSERLDLRLTPEQKDLIQRAADLEGRSLTDFVTSSAQRAAQEAIRTHEVITLTARESREFVETLLNPPAPTTRQREAAARYKREFLEQ